MKVDNFKPYTGQHCETTAVGSLLKQTGYEITESMLFGIGEGLGFLFWNMKTMDFPFIGGRIKPGKITENVCRNLRFGLEVKETSSKKKAWKNIEEPLSRGRAVGLKLDCFHLDYFTDKIHFAGHYAVVYGFDGDFAYLNDTEQQGGQVRTTLKSLELARNEKGPMSSKNLSFTIERVEETPPLESVIKRAVFSNASDYLNPPIKNLGYKGIRKAATEIRNWFHRSKAVEDEFSTSAMLMERAGTGGALFRNLYRDFLNESHKITGGQAFHDGYQEFRQHALKWTEIADLFEKVGKTKEEKYIQKASQILLDLSELERQTMEKLQNACTN